MICWLMVNAQNAQLNVNGIDIERSSNKITDAPQGVTLDLTQKVTDVRVTVTKSNDKATEAIKGWVDSYNSLIDTFNTLTKYKEVDPGAVHFSETALNVQFKAASAHNLQTVPATVPSKH